MIESVIISSAPVEIAEFENHKIATFLISIIDEYDLMGRKIPMEAAKAYHSTIIGFPIVAKLVCDGRDNPVDFRGHEVSKKRDWLGKTHCTFGTFPIGSVIESWIEERNVEGYSEPKNCIMVKAKLWSNRYPEYFKVLDKLWASGRVKTSWEIDPKVVEELTTGQKIFKVFSFIGNAILGSNVAPAVPNAGMVEYAELNNAQNDFDTELSEALEKDLKNEEQEEHSLDKIKEDLTDTNASATGDQTDTASDTVVKEDEKKPEIIETPEPVVEPTDIQDNQKKSLEDEISELKAALLAASEYTQSLTAEVELLRPIREKYEQEEIAKKEEEKKKAICSLKQYALSSKFISEEEIASDEKISQYINDVDEAAVKDLILSRFMASLSQKEQTPEVSQKPKTQTETASIDDEPEFGASLVKLFIQK